MKCILVQEYGHSFGIPTACFRCRSLDDRPKCRRCRKCIFDFQGMLAEKGIRVNGVAPGPILTPLIPSKLPDKDAGIFGSDVPLGRPVNRKKLRRAMFSSAPTILRT